MTEERFIISSLDGEYDHLFKVYMPKKDSQWFYTVPVLFLKPYVAFERSDVKLKPVDLPGEIIMKILYMTFCSLLESLDFNQAFELCYVSRSLVCHFYTCIYGRSQAPMILKAIRLKETLKLCRDLYFDYLAKNREDWQTVGFVNLDYERVAYINGTFYPWEFVSEKLEAIEFDDWPRVENAEKICAFHTGPRHGDSVWMICSTKGGIIYAKRTMGPVLLIHLDDGINGTMVIEKGTETYYYFSRFVMFMKCVFGKRLTVFFVRYDEENNTNLLYELENCVRV